MDEGDARLLAELARQPGWPVLKQLLDEKRDKQILHFGKKVVYGKEGNAAEEAARLRGFYQGADWLIDQADKEFRNMKEENQSD